MQSFRERSGFHGNQPCYQQEPHELSRLESYRHHHGQAGQGYEAHSLAAAGMPTAGAGSKDCYGQQTYPSYSSTPAQTKKPYRGGKAHSQNLQAGYSGHVSSGYSAHYVTEGHLHQKWDESAQMAQYEQDMVGRLEPGVSGSTQYLEQNLLAISQSQCHLPSAPVYTSAHQQGHPSNPAPSPLMYPQSHLHFPQHSQPASSTSSSYMEKCNPIPHGYKSGYGMAPNAQYSRQLGNHSSLKQSGYRPQNNYGYQQPPSRSGFEQQASLQGMPSTPENLQKFQHYNQPQQNYCITDISVRSPEQYYQNCSPSSSHSPARSVGRSPSYSSTPSPLMPNPDTFQYGQPINPAVSSSSAALQDQNMLMPPHTHPSPSVNHQSQSYSSSMKDRFSEKLLSNPSLWSLNALTSQVENISNNVQQLLLSEALMANKKGSKRNQPKKGEDYRGQVRTMEDSSCPDGQHGPLPTDPYGTPRSMPADLQEGGYSSNTEDQMERSYYYFGQGKGPTQASAHSQLTLDTVSTCSMNSADDMSIRSGDSVRSLQSAVSEDNLSCDPRVQRVPFGDEQNTSLRSITDEKSPISVTVPSPMKQECNSPLDIKRSESTLKENFEKSAWTERMVDEKETGKRNVSTENECKGGVIEATEKQQEWLEDKKCPSFFYKINKTVPDESFAYEIEDTVYQELKNKYEAEERDLEKDCGLLDMSLKGNGDSEIKSEIFKSESQSIVESPVTTSPAISQDVFESNQYLPGKEENSDASHLISQGESSEEMLSVSERADSFEEQQSVSSHPATEVGEKRRSLTLAEEAVNNKAKPEESRAEACNKPGEMGGGLLGSTDTAEITVQDIAHRSSERRSAICDIAPQSHSVKNGFSALNEKTTPQTQARDHIDRSDAKVLEPDSPQLPGKSILHSAPSWADTPPSPQKGDGDIEPGISCPSAVTPSAKPEPVAPSALPRLLGRKHARGRRRLIHSNAGIRRQMSVEGDGALPSPQKPSMPSSNSALFPDHMGTAQLDISSQTPKLLTDGCLPSRMCTRSFGSQSSPKVCSQERRKPGPKPGSKPGPKPGPKPGLKPGSKPGIKSGPKPCLKPGPKPGTKPSPKPGPKPGLKAGPKPGSKPGPKPGPKPGAVPSVKPSPKSGPKPGAIPALKPGPKPGSKPTEGGIPKGPGRPRGLTSKIKPMKHEDSVQAITEHIKDTMSATSEQQENTAATLDTLVTTNVDSTMGSTLETALDTTSVKPAAKEQKSMVLRSRKQTRKFTEDIEKERMASAEALAMKLTETPIQEVARPCENQTSDLKFSNHEDICTDSLSQPNEEIVSVSIKRKSSLHSPDPVKKKKNVKVSLTTTQEPPLQTTVVGARGSRGRRKRGHKLEPSICSILAKDNPPPEDISDTPCVPPQCPTKTKYLPPRKGRGLKYEALVQKITSPASKKQTPTVQSDVPEEAPLKQAPEPQVTEHRETENTPAVATEEGDSTVSIEESPDTAFIQTPRKKRKKWTTVERAETPDVVLETGNLIINTPRLAKQRAIKNNHEMHLKQRKRRRKGAELAESESFAEEQEQIQTGIAMPPAERLPSLPAGSSPFPDTSAKTEDEQPSVEISSTIIKPKRGRRPSLKKKQEEAQPMGTDESLKVKKKPGPKKKIHQNSNAIKVIVKGLKTKSKKERIPTVKGKLSDFLQTQESESECSFRPYVHIDSSRELASLCTIVNRPEEEQLLIQSRNTSLVKVKNLVTVTKAIPHSSVMLQGPLVNKCQTDRCVLCCLCGKPANYRELGDLCGPYYSEDSIPRKTLSSVYQEDFRQSRDREKCNIGECSAEQIDGLKGEEGKNLLQEGTCEGDFGQPRRERRTHLRTRLGLRMRFKRLQLLHRGAGGAAPPAGEAGCDCALQRLQLEAEGKEHWAHEPCAVWTSGVILVASKLYGLREAAQHSTVTNCSKCQTEGASIGCSWSNCTHKYHYVCAKETGCTFEEDTFSIKCPKHKPL